MAEQLDRLKAALADRYAIREELRAGGSPPGNWVPSANPIPRTNRGEKL